MKAVLSSAFQAHNNLYPIPLYVNIYEEVVCTKWTCRIGEMKRVRVKESTSWPKHSPRTRWTAAANNSNHPYTNILTKSQDAVWNIR